METLNPTSIVVALIIALVGGTLILVVEYRTGWFAGSRKEVTYEILATGPLLFVNQAVRSRVEILFDNERIDDMTLLIIKLTNSGRTTIYRDDYESPIKLLLSPEVKIYEANIMNKNPTNLDLSVEVTENPNLILVAEESRNPLDLAQSPQVSIAPTLLNSGDSFTIGLFLSGYRKPESAEKYLKWGKGIVIPGSSISVEGRIAGIKQIRKFDRNVIKKKRVKKIKWISVILILLFFFSFLGRLVTSSFTFALMIGVIITVTITAILLNADLQD